MAHQYVQLPPDSTGKKLFHRAEIILTYKNGVTAFSIGDTVVCGTSGVTGDVVYVSGTVSAGDVHILLTIDSGTVIVDGEDLNVGGSKYAEANGTGNFYYTPVTQVTGSNSPRNSVFVDQYGGLYIRFSEGDPQLDAFGKFQVSQSTKIAEYVHKYDKLPDLIHEEVAGSASSTHSQDIPSVLMSVTDSTADSIIRTTNLYHSYQSGKAQTIEMTTWLGDSGKSGNIRRWGYFDEKNGFFFELSGTTLYIVVRSSATGSVVETRVAQVDWNKDTLDGNGDFKNLSSYSIDLTKSNIFWMDLQWLGAGRIRFGVNIDGKRIVCHEHYHANYFSRTNVGSSSLPIRWENFNTTPTSGSSELNAICAAVYVEGALNFPAEFVGLDSRLETINDSTNWIPIVSTRMKQTFNSLDNRKVAFPVKSSIFNNGNIAVEVAMIYNGTLSGATWNDNPGSYTGIEQDIEATSISGGSIISKVIIKGNAEKVITWNFGSTITTAVVRLLRKADITETPVHLSIAVRLFEGESGSTNVKAITTWRESE